MRKKYLKILSLCLVMVLSITSISFTSVLDETVPSSPDQVKIKDEISIPNYETLDIESEESNTSTGNSNHTSSGNSSNTSDNEDNEEEVDSVQEVDPENLASELKDATTKERASVIIDSVSKTLSKAIDEDFDEETKKQVIALSYEVSKILDEDLMDSESSSKIVKKIIDENLSKMNKDINMSEKDKIQLKKTANQLANKAIEKSGQITLEADGTISLAAAKKAIAAVNKTTKTMEETLEKSQLKGKKENALEKKITIKGGVKSLSLDLETIDTLNKASMALTIRSNNMALNLDTEMLKTLGNKSVTVKSEVISEESSKLLKEKAGKAYNLIQTNDIDVSAMTEDGKSEQLNNISIKIDIPDNSGNDDHLSVVIYNEGTGTFERVKSWVVDGRMVLKTPHYSLYSVAKYNNTYEDIGDHWGKENIIKMTARGIVDGYSKKEFKPNGEMTRAEFIKLLVVAFDLESEGKNIFEDINSEDWYSDYVRIALRNGLLNHMTGINGRKLQPNVPITREDMMILINNMYVNEIGEEMSVDNDYYNDLNLATKIGQKAIKNATALALIEGYDDGTFRPKNTITRAEAMKVLSGFMDLMK